MAESEYTPINLDLDRAASLKYAALMNEWAKSEGEEQESDSELLKEFKRFRLQFTDNSGKGFTLTSLNEFAQAQKRIKAGEATDDLMDPWIDAAIAAHNVVKSPSQRLERSTYQQQGWSKTEIIHDALLYAALPAFAHQKAQETH